MFDFQPQPTLTGPGLSILLGMIHMISSNIQLNEMLVFAICAACLAHKVVASLVSIHCKDWKHATGNNALLNGHSNCITHKQSVIAWKQFQFSTKQGTSISQQLDNTRVELIQKNRHTYLKTILEVLLLCSKQEIAL